jgi:hypothetical protein
MNNKLLLTATLLAGTVFAQAQQNRTTYAITGDGNQDFVWMNIRQVDINTGEVVKTLFERSKTDFVIKDVNGNTSRNQTSFATDNIFTNTAYPTGSLVAAAAYDQRTNKLFFVPMKNNELRWLDLNSSETTPTFYTKSFINAGRTTDPYDEAANITRMVIGADGMGYAMSNDGNHFYSFTTGKRTEIVDLGNIIDADANSAVSIHNKCTSWGGDLIADAYGKLHVISANHHVFVIDPATRIATYKGMIQGLPAGYTTNAAAVNDEGEVIIASANLFDGYYKLSMSDLKVSKIAGSNTRFNISDFANANLLFAKQAGSVLNNQVIPAATLPVEASVYPNPVTNSSFSIKFQHAKEGRYRINMTDLAGRTMLTRTTRLANGTQIERINTKSSMPKGVYFVSVVDENNQTIIKEKIILQ